MRGRQAVAWCAAGAMALAGCGGGDDDEPTAAEKRAAQQRWVQRADDACEKFNRGVADRGWPVDLVDLDRVVVRAVTDAQETIRTITRLRLPAGASRDARAFVADLRRIGPALEGLSAASEDLAPDALLRAADALKPRLSTLEKRARAAGLAECMTNDERFLVPDAVRAPVFAEQLARLDRSLFRRLERLTAQEPRTAAGVAAYYEKLGEILDANVEGLDRLEPPQWAAAQTSAYQHVLLDYKTLIGKAQTLFSQGADDLTLRKLTRLQRQFRHMARRERKARRRMLRAVGAAPTTRGGGEEPAEPEEQIVS